MRIAILMNLAPRKLGSFEGWITAMCEKARERGHAVDVYGREPIHAQFRRRLQELGVGWYTVASLETSAYEGIRRLAQYDVIHMNMFAPRSRIGFLAYAAYPAKVMFVDHTSGPIPREKKRDSGAVSFLKRAADAVTELRITGIAGVSEYVSERNRRRFSPKKVKTIYNGVDVRRFIPKDEFFDLVPPKRTVKTARDLSILVVAHLIRHKGVDYLIRGVANAQNKQLKLRIVGDGPELENLKRLAITLGISNRVEFLGLRDDVNALLQQTDIFVHPAIWEEAFGLTIAEAMAAEKPVVATRIGGIPELIEHERSGLLVSPESASELANALDVLSDHPEFRDQLGKNARLKANEHFSLNSCAKEHIDWCESAVKLPSRKKCVFRPSRSPIPAHPDHLFRSMPITWPR